MDMKRRQVMRAGGAMAVFGLFVSAGLVKPGTALAARNEAAFAAKGIQDAMKAFGATGVEETTLVNWGSTPTIAENGAVVPVSVTSSIPGTESIAILIEKNPSSLAAHFEFPQGTDPSATTRVKLSESSNVHALVKAGGKYYVATGEIKVTLGGCGG